MNRTSKMMGEDSGVDSHANYNSPAKGALGGQERVIVSDIQTILVTTC